MKISVLFFRCLPPHSLRSLYILPSLLLTTYSKTAPNVPHYNKNKAKGIMKKGHVFTVEPMINLGSYQDITWGDNWTAVTSDGKRSAQFEHTVLVTDTGCEILTAREDEPVMTWKPELVHR